MQPRAIGGPENASGYEGVHNNLLEKYEMPQCRSWFFSFFDNLMFSGPGYDADWAIVVPG